MAAKFLTPIIRRNVRQIHGVRNERHEMLSVWQPMDATGERTAAHGADGAPGPCPQRFAKRDGIRCLVSVGQAALRAAPQNRPPRAIDDLMRVRVQLKSDGTRNGRLRAHNELDALLIASGHAGTHSDDKGTRCTGDDEYH